MSGLAVSMQGFIQMLRVSGLVAPLLFDSAFKLALGHAVTVLRLILWALAVREAQTSDNAA